MKNEDKNSLKHGTPPFRRTSGKLARAGRYLIFFLMLATVTSLNAQSQKKKDRIEQLNAQLTAFYEAKDWENARISVKKLYRLYKPYRAYYYYCLGNIAEQEGNIDEATKIYKQTISRYKKSDFGYYNLGRIYYNRGIEIQVEANKKYYDISDERYSAEREKSKECFRQALPLFEKGFEINPNYEPYPNVLRACYYQLEMLDKYNEIERLIEERQNKK